MLLKYEGKYQVKHSVLDVSTLNYTMIALKSKVFLCTYLVTLNLGNRLNYIIKNSVKHTSLFMMCKAVAKGGGYRGYSPQLGQKLKLTS